MKRFSFFTVVAAGLVSLASIPALSQNANLNVGGVPVASCSYSSLTVDSSNGAVNITCTTSVNYTGNNNPPPAGTFALSVTISGAGTVTATNSTGGALTLNCGTTSCSGQFTASQTVILTATPASGGTFSGWSASTGSVCSGTGTCNFTMDANKAVTATFSGSGTPTPTPSGVVMLSTPPLCGTANGSMSSYTMGTTYSFPLPKTSTGSGLIGISTEGGVGTNAQLELSLSKTPGDWATAKAMGQTTTIFFTSSTSYPYYQQGSGYLTMNWRSSDDRSGSPIVSPVEQWYVNFRMSNATGWLTVQLSSPGCN